MYKSEYQNIFANHKTHWWYLGMRQITIALLDKHLSRKRNLKILDAGCGPGTAFSYLKRYGQLIGVDASDEALRYARKHNQVKIVKASVSSLPFKDNSFDLVVCLDVLYHLWVKNINQALKEFNRVLKPGGFLFLREPAFKWLKSSHDLVDFGQRRFTKRQLQQALKRNSFKVGKISYANFLLFPLVLLKRLPESLKLKKTSPKSDIRKLPPVLNLFLFKTLRTEAILLKYFNLPWGSSLICLAEKVEKVFTASN